MPTDNGMEFDTNWKPLEDRIGKTCAEFMWMYRIGGCEYHKHIDTRRYLLLDSEGRCFSLENLVPKECDFAKHLKFVRGTAHG